MKAPHDQYRRKQSDGCAEEGSAINLHADTAEKNYIGDAHKCRGNCNQQVGAVHLNSGHGKYVAEVWSVSQTVMLLIRGALGTWRICLEVSSNRNLAIFSADGLIWSNGG